MESLNFIESIEFTGDNYVKVNVNSNYRLDDFQFSIVNNSGNNLINCIKDRYEANSLLYYVENYIPLKHLIRKNVFSAEDFRKLINQITDEVLWTKQEKLIISNIIFNMDYIFVDKYSYDLRLIYIPVMVSEDFRFSMEAFQDLIKNIINIINVNNANEFVGLILSSVNSLDFDLAGFKKKIADFKIRKDEDKHDSKSIKQSVISFMCLLFFCIVIPTIGNVAKIRIITNYIDYKSIVAFLILFLAGEFLLIIMHLLLNRKHKEIKKVETTALNSHSYEFSKSLLSKEIVNEPKIEKNETIIPKDREYNPVKAGKFDVNSRKVNENSLKNPLNEDLEGGTEVLLSEDAEAYLIKNSEDGNYDRTYIDKDIFNIGRDNSKSDFVILESSVSKQHATITHVENQYYITDNKSSNGTYLNGTKLYPNKKYEINNNDKVVFADQEYKAIIYHQ